MTNITYPRIEEIDKSHRELPLIFLDFLSTDPLGSSLGDMTLLR